MKPRLYRRDGIWVCRSIHPLGGRREIFLGYGYSVAEAFRDWQERRGMVIGGAA